MLNHFVLFRVFLKCEVLLRFLFLVCNWCFFFRYILPLPLRPIDKVDEFDDDDDEFDNVGGLGGERITLRFLLFCRVKGGGTKGVMGEAIGAIDVRGGERGSSSGTVKRY